MKATSTFISWPFRLKLGAKTKKGNAFSRLCFFFNVLSCVDPNVRIVGKPDDVLKAKDKILESLDSKVSAQ